ncbi:unnamed protein product [Clonostachys rhizophaga]|uniref:Uncharacterized protein n=1 Tax=Clonostachys rhizophaga TaxID=160324 RepID=A0A9N9VJM8_9HYPO|nr:unnamed protein product [Clonostachys rhizophaga]
MVKREAELNFGKWGKRYISVGTKLVLFQPDMSETDLILTYIFNWDSPSVQKGVVKSRERAQELVAEG